MNLLGGGEEQGSKILKACLVGKLWIDKSFNVRDFINTIHGV